MAAGNLRERELFVDPDLFLKYKNEWLNRLACATEFGELVALALPSASAANESGIVFNCYWNPSAPDGSKFVMKKGVEVRTFTGHPNSLCITSDSLQRTRSMLAEATNQEKVGVMRMFVMFNATDVPEISSPAGGGNSSSHIVTIPLYRILWEFPWHGIPAGLGEERKRITETRIAELIQTMNTKYGKKLHKKASASK